MEVYVPEETTGIRYHIWRLVTSPPFENFIMLLIVLNTVLLMMKVRTYSTSLPNARGHVLYARRLCGMVTCMLLK